MDIFGTLLVQITIPVPYVCVSFRKSCGIYSYLLLSLTQSVISRYPFTVTAIWLERWQVFKFYSVQKYHLFSIENGKFVDTKPVIPHKPLHVTAIWLKLWHIQTILNINTISSVVYDLYPIILFNAKIAFFSTISIY